MFVGLNADGQRVIRMAKPICTHQHVRRGKVLELTVPMIAKRFHAAIIMPNTQPPITTLEMVDEYRMEVFRAIQDERFTPMMTLYLTDNVDPSDMILGGFFAVKYYPFGLTTNSLNGVVDPSALWRKDTKPYQALREMAESSKVLILHAADGFARRKVRIRSRSYSAGDELDPYDQEPHFFRETLPRIRDAHPLLKCEVAHLSTAEGAEYMRIHGCETLGCSLTCHHLLNDRRDVMRGGFRPHLDWRPVIQSMEHRQELQKLAAEDHYFVWLGMDSAPHARKNKEAACCATGVLTVHAGIELYAEAFDVMGALDERFENFSSLNAARFYNLPDARKSLELVNESWTVRSSYFAESPEEEMIPYRLGTDVLWKIID
jgi:dihydroorotase